MKHMDKYGTNMDKQQRSGKYLKSSCAVGCHPAISARLFHGPRGRWRAAGQSCSVDAVNWDDVDSVVYVAGGTVRFSGYTWNYMDILYIPSGYD